MNYYEHHLGDYLRDTAHLNMLEDGAYRRLLDAYYIREKPLPGELRDVYRLVRAASKQDREAVDVVLREFFQQTAGGWRHERCELELARFREGEADRDAARENAKERQRRTRERRRELFEALRSHDIVPAYDTATSELQRLLSRVTSPPVTRDKGEAVTRDATATHTQTPDLSPSLRSGERARATRLPPDWEPNDADWGEACLTLRTTGAKAELAKFRDYWKAKPGKDGTKLDWDATWRNWVRRAADSGKGRGNSAPSRESAVDRVRRLNAAALEDGGEILAAHDGNLRPQVDVGTRRDADGLVVDGAFRVVG